MNDANREQLVTAARLLKPLLDELVFLGGSVTGLLITDEGAGAIRTTLDVDAIVKVSSYAEYAAFGERLRQLDFVADTRDGAPVYRWVHGSTILDVMPLNEKILGFSNPWYPGAMETAAATRLAKDLTIRVITAPFFLATKLEAFKGRGKGDFLGSHDLEDLVCLIDGRPEITAELRLMPAQLRSHVGAEIRSFLAAPKFLDALPAYLFPDEAGQARIEILLERLRSLASL